MSKKYDSSKLNFVHKFTTDKGMFQEPGDIPNCAMIINFEDRHKFDSGYLQGYLEKIGIYENVDDNDFINMCDTIREYLHSVFKNEKGCIYCWIDK